MDVFYHIVHNSIGILLSNLSKDKIKEAVDYPIEFKSDIIEGIKRRREKIHVDNGWIYLTICDNDITNKYFKKYLDFLKSLYEPLCNLRKEYAIRSEDKVRRLKHNINGYTTKIQDELENVIPSNINRNDWNSILQQLKTEISKNNEITATTVTALFHIYKNVQLIKAEMEVYDIMNSDTANLNLIEHPIRKVVDLSVQSFFLDLLDRNINIKHGLSTDKVLIDFPTFSVVLGHILDNTVKYAANNSTLDISFERSYNTVKIKFSMTSILVNPDEVDKIFQEKYSGHWASESGLQGHGIGMYYAKKLVELNNGTINFVAGKEKYQFEGLPYADNIIEITLKRAI